MNCPYCIKVCSKCGEILVANSMNFRRQKDGKFGLISRCKRCEKEYYKEYRENNKEEIKEYKKEYYENNKEEINKKNKEYYENNKEEILKKHKEYRENNKEYFKEYKKQYKENNPNKVFNDHHKRRQLKEQQGNGITKEQWLEMMKFFDFKCAYSGVVLNKNNRSIDHIISLNSSGEHEIWNLVPMLINYNSSKQDDDMLEWYMKQEFFNIDRLRKIFEWCDYAFEKWGNQ